MGKTHSKSEINEKDLANTTEGKLSVSEVHDVIESFRKISPNGEPLEFKKFVQVVAELKKKYPKNEVFDEDYSKVVFEMLDSDNNHKIDPEELIKGISILSKGTPREKAKLTFTAFDLNKDGFLQRNELQVQLETVFSVAAKILSIEAEKEGGSFAKVAMEGMLKMFTTTFINELVQKAFLADTNNDGVLSPEEWAEGAENNESIQMILDPWLLVRTIQASVNSK